MSKTATKPRLGQRRDQRIVLHAVLWDQFEQLLDIRGDGPGFRVTYLDGELELMSPSTEHERIKTFIARLLEVYAEERHLRFDGFGSWTVKQEGTKSALEPDECYTVGSPPSTVRPDLAIEVVRSAWSVNKLEVYRRLGVPEVWVFRRGKITVHELTAHGYVTIPRSALLPDLDIPFLLTFLDQEDQTHAARTYRGSLRATP